MRFLIFFLTLPFLWSFKFNPMSQSIELNQNNKAAQFLLENDSAESMAIELTVVERQMDENGKEVLPKTKELTIFPPQMVIPSKEKRTIRVSWVGAPELVSEKSYRVIAEQLPLNVDEKTKRRSGIQMLMKYMAALYVTPVGAEPKLSTSIEAVEKDGVILMIENSGSQHKILSNPTVIFEQDRKMTFKAGELVGLAGENVLAHSKRRFKVKSATAIKKDSKVTLKIEE